jgi:hypothetical protein
MFATSFHIESQQKFHSVLTFIVVCYDFGMFYFEGVGVTMHDIKKFRRTLCLEVSFCSIDEIFYVLCKRVYLVINTPHNLIEEKFSYSVHFCEEFISVLLYEYKLLSIMP